MNMSHIKDRLSDYHDWAQDIANKYGMITAREFLYAIEQLQDDLEQDEKENGWIPVDDDDGGTFRVGDEDESFVDHDLYVNAWMPLPEPYKED